ncbi:hypothetical protein EYR36_011734 [Pleurotus pulmonarius]|nr:hypothetical protein EYR36_011734 [Pleurotus pulmonarius]KAF4607366.1 hypothetical protein EYR38_001434 [Pleurotus pulmonarius]
MTVLPRRRSDCRLEAGRPVARGRGVRGGVTAVGAGKKRGRRHSRKKAAPSPTTRVNAAAKRKEKAGKARRSSQSNKARNQHNKQPLGTAASQSHSNSLPAVNPKAKNSGRASIANTSGRRVSASSSLPPPKPLARIPPRSPPLPRTSGRKTKSRNSQPQRKRQQRKLPPSGPLKSPPNTSEKNILAAVAARLEAQRKNRLKQDKSSPKSSPKSSLSLPHGRVVTQSSRHPSKSLHRQPVTSAHDNPGRPQDAQNKAILYSDRATLTTTFAATFTDTSATDHSLSLLLKLQNGLPNIPPQSTQCNPSSLRTMNVNLLTARTGLKVDHPAAQNQSPQSGAVAAQSATTGTIGLDSDSQVAAISTSAVSGRKQRRRRGNTSKQPPPSTPTSPNVTATKGAWMHYPPAHFNRSNQIPLANIVYVANTFFHQDLHSTTVVNKSSRGYTKKSNSIALDPMVNSTVTTVSKGPSNKSLKRGIGAGRYSTTPALPHVSEVPRSSQASSSQVPSPANLAGANAQRVSDDNKSLPQTTKVKSDHSTAPASPQGPTSSPPPINVNSRHTSTDRPPTICERYHITDPLNDYRFRTNDYAPEFSVAEEEDFQRRLAECHIFNMTQPDASVNKPRVNVKKQKQKQKKQKQKQKTEAGGTAAGTPSKGKAKGKN